MSEQFQTDEQLVDFVRSAALGTKWEPVPVAPSGTAFFDRGSSREMMIVHEGSWAGWIVYKHPDGQWVSLRKATDADRRAINQAIIDAHHNLD